MCTLISRGDLISSPAVATLDSVDLASIKTQGDESIKPHEPQDDIKVDIDMHTMETDLGSLFAMKDEPRMSPDPPGEINRIFHQSQMQIVKSQPKGKQIMLEMRFIEFPALFVDRRVEISLSA